MSEHILFLTGKLAEKQLLQVLEEMQPTEFSYSVHRLGLSVAALMTADMIRRRLKDTFGANRIVVPGRCRGDLKALSEEMSIPFERGPKEVKDLPGYFGKKARQPDLNQYQLKIFAEIVDAPNITIDEIVEQAYAYQQDGADIIDIGCLPDTPFPHLHQAIRELKRQNFTVSIDSLETNDLLAGAKAGADFMLSLHENTLWIADQVDTIPILIPAQPADLDSLDRAIEKMAAKGGSFIVDSILDPIHFGFTDSLVRYHEVRKRYPEIDMLMGVGNLTELTHADTAGMNALLLGICSELEIDNILATQVSQHACKAVKEADLARRILYAARNTNSLPKHLDNGLMGLHECDPFPYNNQEIESLADKIKDPSFRIQVSPDGIYIYNRDGIHRSADPFDLYPKLNVEEDGGHAFYLGVQLARAQVAWQLGKRFDQDEPLGWGCAVEYEAENLNEYKEAGKTMKKKRKP